MKTEDSSTFEVERVPIERRLSSIYLAPFQDGAGSADDNDVARRLSLSLGEDLFDLTHDAKAAVAAEHSMSVREALRLYPKAVAFSAVLSLALIMEGYDTALIGSFFALPQFQQKYGERLSDGSYQLTAAWESGLQNGSAVGSIIGLYLSGLVHERYGYRKTLLGALLMMILCIFVVFFAHNIKMLLAGEVLCGICWGVFQTQTTTYAAEVTPVVLRVYLTSFVNLCWITGQLISAGVVRAMVSQKASSQWAFRIPFALQWIWPVPIIIGVLLAPESPWQVLQSWLVRKGRIEEAKHSLNRLTSKRHVGFNVDHAVALMVHTNALEKEITSGPGTSYKDCFKGTDLRRTEIVCCVWMCQITCGQPFAGLGAYFFRSVNFTADQAFSLNLGLSGAGFVATVLSWFLMRYVGRRTLYVYGLLAMFSWLLTIGILAVPPASSGLTWAMGSLMCLFVFTFDVSVGPACYSLVAEIPATRLRNKSVVLARCCYNVVGIVSNIINPRMLNPSAWNLRGKTGFFWAGTCFVSLIWTAIRLPEPKGLTYAELDILFEKKASARKFSRFRILLEESGYFCVTTTNSVTTASGSTTLPGSGECTRTPTILKGGTTKPMVGELECQSSC